MKILKLLIFSCFVLLGCEDLPFTDEDIQNEAPKSEATKEEIAEEVNDNLQIENEIPVLPHNQKEISILIEERESVADTKETENLKTPIVKAMTESFGGEVKVSITDSSLEEAEEDFDITDTKEKVTEWKISRKETERQNLENEIPESKSLKEIKPPLSEDEITLISEDLEIEEDTVIQNRKVVLNMVAIKTFEHDLTIKSEEFVTNHSVIQNFPEGQKTKKREHGKSGGNILIEAESAKGELQLILNGEEAGRVSNQEIISKKERAKLKGRRGQSGRDAVYKTHCRSGGVSLSVGSMPVVSIPVGQECQDECISPPTAGQNGGNGLQGVPGSDGKNGGSSGSFYLKAFELSDFHLTSIQNNPGIGSKGSRGSVGGFPGVRGRNGRDSKKLCNHKLPPTSKGKKGKRGPSGKSGENGKKGTVCLERLIEDTESSWERGDRQKENTICY